MVSIKDFSIRVGNQMADPFDTIIIERMAQRKVDIEFRREIAIRQIERMAFLTLQVRITLINKHRILIVKVRIQVPDSRSPNTHIISSTQVLRLSKLDT